MSVTEVLTHSPAHWLDGVPPDKRVVIADVTWDCYESLVEQIGESRNCRVAYDGKDIEMMTLGPFHERQKSLLDWFIMIVAAELKIEPPKSMGSTTWKRKKPCVRDRVRCVLLLRSGQASRSRGRLG